MDRNALLTTTRAAFLQLFSDAVGDLIPRSMDQLFNTADGFSSAADQGLMLDARSVLMHRNVELQQKMARSMEQLLNRSFQTAYNSFRPSFSSAFGSTRFSLVEPSTLEDELRIDTITKRFRNEAEEQLRDLNIRVALLLEQDDIKERENPFRPYLFARCIASVVESLALAPALTAVLSEQLATDLTNNIANIYDGINAHLARNGIAAQLQLKIKKMPDQSAASGAQPAPGGGQARTSQRPPATAVRESRTDQLFEMIKGIAGNALQSATPEMPPGAGAARAGWLSGTQVAGDALRTFFSEPSSPGIRPRMAGAFKTSYAPSRLTRSIHGLLRESTPAGDAMVGADGAIRNLVAEQRVSLNGATHDSAEQMTIDIVAMLFEFILRDSQIPSEVRAQLGRLQFLVLKAALLEPELLTRKSHPARMMINRIGSISIGLKQVDPSGIRITAEISRIVATLLDDETENPQIFSKMLDQLDAFIARELRASDMQVERAAQAVEKAENRTLHFAHTTAQIGAALSGLTIAPFLHDFFITTWAHAIERASRTDSKREKRFKQLIADLLWSIVPKVTGQDRAQLLALLPIMLLELRDGLELAGLEQRQRQDVLDWLIDAHTQAMRPGSDAAVSYVPSLSDTHQHFEPFIAQTGENPAPLAAAGQHAGDGNFIREAVRELDIDLRVIDAAFDPAPGPGRPLHDRPTAEDDAVFMARLRSGEMVEINLGTTWTQGRLSWVSPNALHLLLSAGHNNTLSVLGLPVLRQLLANGRVRFPETAPLFERAVQSLLQAADRVDGSAIG